MSMRTVEVEVDVTDAVSIGEPLTMAATVVLPDVIPEQPIVCFALPGGGYNRRYFTFDMPGSSGSGQAGWHAARGWIFIGIDTLNTGDSTKPAEPGRLSYEKLAASNDHVVRELLGRLANGTLADGVDPVTDPRTIGFGHSLGGSLTVLTQGQLHPFDAIVVLGFSARHTMIWAPPGLATGRRVYLPRGTNVAELTADVFQAAMPEMAFDEKGWPLCAPGFHLDDVPADIVAMDMANYPTRNAPLPEWASATIPPAAMTMMSPGSIASEAASITTPVFVGVGELDTIMELDLEPAAYEMSDDVTLFRCRGAAHMHNFATTRETMWARVHGWAESVVHTSAVSAQREEARA
ncbi:alpha/beta hydrolase [Microbacterium sp. X-17]|uniref:alpha/beta hydrolase n=1 Tax=Microbacterium sp. X-17 TaxID=3144404 RepID=UPI0031F52FDB